MKSTEIQKGGKQIRVTEAIWYKLKVKAAKERKTITAIITDLVSTI